MNTFKTPKGTTLPILNLKGKDYLQVAHRLVWFREEHPNAQILTEFVKLDNDFTIAKASIIDERGVTLATGHKREDRGHFQDHMEKAEAGAVGRALAYCGFGTQFCSDELDEGQRIVDAPQLKPQFKPQPAKSEPAKPATQAKKFEQVADFVISFGEDKNKTLGELGPQNVAKKISSITKSKSEFAKSQMAKEFLFWAEQYMKKNPLDELDQALSDNKPNSSDVQSDDWTQDDRWEK
jgi:hypothetical protein